MALAQVTTNNWDGSNGINDLQMEATLEMDSISLSPVVIYSISTKPNPDIMKYVLSIFCLFTLFVQPSAAQKNPALAGDWKGHIEIPGRKLGFATHFQKTGNEYSGTIDVPKQGVSTAHLEKVNFIEPDSALWVWNTGSSGIIRFKGVIKTDSTIDGKFTQHGYTFPFQLHKEKSPKEAANSEKLPYKTKQLIIKRDSIPIGGTLTLPSGPPPQKAIILISGSGAQNRDEETPFGFKPFEQISDYLTRAGIATFRFDDRGIGESGGDPNVGFGELAKDVHAIIDSLSQRKDLSQTDIGLLGHSQGGYIADMLAGDAKVKFIVYMSAAFFPGDQIITQQTRAIEQAKGTPNSVIQKGIEDQHRLFTAIQENNLNSLRKTRIQALEDTLKNLPESKRQQIGDLHEYAAKKVGARLSQYKWPIFQSMMRYDPIHDVQQLKSPVLALFGEKDLQVLPQPNIERLRKALEQSGTDYTIKTIDSANHLYQPAKTGLPSEYKSLPHKFVDGFLPTIEDWLKRTGN